MSGIERDPSKMKPRSGFKDYATKLLLFGIVSVICLLLLEVMVRWLFPFYSPRTQVPFHKNPEGVVLGFPLQTSRQRTPKGDFEITLSFNRHGFRDPKDTAAGTPKDLFVAGDSFSMGWGVEERERFSNLIEEQLGVSVYNISIPEDIRGYSATVKYARKQGARIQHLIIGLCMENDLWDYSLPVSNHELYGKQMNKGAARTVYNWFKRHSALWVCASHLVQQSRFGRACFEKLGIARNIEALTHPNEPDPKILSATRDELLKLATNYHSLVLVIPSRGLWYGKNSSNEKKIHDDLMTMMREAGLKLVDMRPVFEKTGNPLQFYFSTDPHWNVAGHKAAGQELCNYLQTQSDWKGVLSMRAALAPGISP